MEHNLYVIKFKQLVCKKAIHEKEIKNPSSL